jgi:hypothetical protein
LRGYLKCKGQNNEDKGYFELTGVTKREPLKKKLHLKPLVSKGPNKPGEEKN